MCQLLRSRVVNTENELRSFERGEASFRAVNDVVDSTIEIKLKLSEALEEDYF